MDIRPPGIEPGTIWLLLHTTVRCSTNWAIAGLSLIFQCKSMSMLIIQNQYYLALTLLICALFHIKSNNVNSIAICNHPKPFNGRWIHSALFIRTTSSAMSISPWHMTCASTLKRMHDRRTWAVTCIHLHWPHQESNLGCRGHNATS